VKADSTSSEKEKDEKKLPVGQRVEREVIAWFWVALAFMLINGTIGQARVIPSGSMENTLLIGDHLIMSRIGYDAGVPFTNWHVPLWRNPHRQQVIIFKPPFAPDTPDYVKRTIGLPGDTIDLRGGAVYVNGQKLCVPRNDIIGTPVMIYMSLDVPPDAWEPGQIRERFFAYASAILHPGVVRWRRLFHTF
jgi:signal peptidase I